MDLRLERFGLRLSPEVRSDAARLTLAGVLLLCFCVVEYLATHWA